MNPANAQLPLFERSILEEVRQSGQVKKVHLKVAQALGLDEVEVNRIEPAGKHCKTSLFKRKVRWAMQSLKHAGLLTRTEQKGQWALTDLGKKLFQTTSSKAPTIAFYTDHGVFFFADSFSSEFKQFLKEFEGSVRLICTSPPYLLAQEKAYGSLGQTERAHVNKLLDMIEGHLMPLLSDDGSLVLNLGDSYHAGTGGHMSLSNERLLIGLEDRGLKLCQRLVWENPSKPPSGFQVTNARTRLKTVTEHVFWLAKDPSRTRADNRRVLQAYSPLQQQNIRQQAALAIKKDGPSRRHTRPSGQSFDPVTANKDLGGAIPGNLLKFVHEPSQTPYNRLMRENKLIRHPATQPYELAQFLIRFLTEPGDCVYDPFGGSGVTALAAEQNNRHWLSSEIVGQYAQAAALRFSSAGIPSMRAKFC